MEAALVRTQIYLSAAQQAALGRMAQQRKAPKSQLIREAVDAYIAQNDAAEPDKLALLRQAFGVSKGREDMADSAQYVSDLRRKNQAARAKSLADRWNQE